MPGVVLGLAVRRCAHLSAGAHGYAVADFPPCCAAHTVDSAHHGMVCTSVHHRTSDRVYHAVPSVDKYPVQYLTEYLTSNCVPYRNEYCAGCPSTRLAPDDGVKWTQTCTRIERHASNHIHCAMDVNAVAMMPPWIGQKIFFSVRRVAVLAMLCRPRQRTEAAVHAAVLTAIRLTASLSMSRFIHGRALDRVWCDTVARMLHAPWRRAAQQVWNHAVCSVRYAISRQADAGVRSQVWNGVRIKAASTTVLAAVPPAWTGTVVRIYWLPGNGIQRRVASHTGTKIAQLVL